MYEKRGTPPCGALNSYIWNNCTGEIAEESEKAVVDVQTLQKTNQDIIDTLDKVTPST